MKYWVGSFAAVIGALTIGVGCRTSRPSSSLPPFPSSGNPGGWDEMQIAAARTLYVNKCLNCHKFHRPNDYSQSDWNDWMTKMSRKAKLSAQQETTLRQFLEGYRMVE